MVSSSWHLLPGGIVNSIFLLICCVNNIFWLARASRPESDCGLLPLLVHQSEPFKSRNKKGRIDSPSSKDRRQHLDTADQLDNSCPSELLKDHVFQLLQVRGGSQRRPSSSSSSSQPVKPQLESNKTRRYYSRKRPSSTRISRSQEKYNKEIDAYIDFLIATYCPDDDDNDNNNDKSLVQNVVSTNTKMTRKAQRKRRMKPHQKKQTQISAASRRNVQSTAGNSSRGLEVSRSSGLIADPSVSPALPNNNMETSHTESTTPPPPEEETSEYTNVMQQQQQQPQASSSWNSTMQFNQEERLVEDSSAKNNNGGGDDDGDSEDEDMVTDAELLDQYIEFLQQDYEQDQALDQYIEFLQQDYDKDRALDQYIDFLLATTTASVPATRTASSRSQQNVTTIAAAAAAATTTTESIDTSSARALGTVVNAEEIIVVYPDATEEATDNSLSETIKKELDAYIDQLVTAVELDEYIDRLVESVSTASTEELALAVDEVEEPEDEEAIDSYIDDLASSSKAPVLEHPLDIMPTEPIRVPERPMETTKSTSSSNEPAIADEKEKEEVVIAAAKLSKKQKKKRKRAIQGIDDYIDSLVQGASDLSETGELGYEDAVTTSEQDEPGTRSRVSISAGQVSGTDFSETSASVEYDETSDEPKIAVGLTDSGTSSPPSDGDDDDDEKLLPKEGVVKQSSPARVEMETKPKKKHKKKKKLAVDSVGIDDQEAAVPDTSSPESERADPVAIDDGSERPIIAPNGLYRFLLRKGPIGHVLVLALVLLIEWIQVYVPQLADLLALLWLRLAPSGIQRRLAPQRYSPGTSSSMSPDLSQLYTGRMPVKGRQRAKLSKRADEEALAKLQRIGDIQDAKYKHVSASFMKRHRLGPYREDDDNDFDEKDTDLSVQTVVRKKKRRLQAQVQDEEDESDVEWILQGLTDDETNKVESKPSLRTSVSVGMSSNGPSVSVGVGTGNVGLEVELIGNGGPKNGSAGKKKTSIDREAIVRDAVRKKTSGPRASDRDGGSGVMGRLRAAATSNSIVSRSLLGAYPGDAVPLSEAADARGVTGLAQKYGYGDWSDDDDDEYDDSVDDCEAYRKGKSSRKRRSKNKERNIELEDVTDDIRHAYNYSVPSTSGKKRSRSSTKQRLSEHSSEPREDPEVGRTKMVRPALDLLNEVKKTKRNKVRRSDGAKPKMVRPALELLNEHRKSSSGKAAKDVPVQRKDAVQTSLEELKKKYSTSQGNDKLIRPALERSRDIDKLKNSSDERGSESKPPQS